MNINWNICIHTIPSVDISVVWFDDGISVAWWRHDLEMISHYLPFVWVIHRWPVYRPWEGPGMQIFCVPFVVSQNKLLN